MNAGQRPDEPCSQTLSRQEPGPQRTVRRFGVRWPVGEATVGARHRRVQTGVAVLIVLLAAAAPAQPPSMPGDAAGPPAPSQDGDPQAQHQVMESMGPGHHPATPHRRLTPARPVTPEDLARAQATLEALRAGIEKYRDYRVALADDYQIFLPQVPQKEYHFTNYRNGFLAAFAFDPAHPTSLLYRRTADGYRLVGAMYTMPRTATETELDRRVPLSVATWHQHTNVCLPGQEQRATADWTKFGPAGSIATAGACATAGGTFRPVIFGWMVHVYPYEESPEKIWGHMR